MKAMIFAAGLGSRLKELTAHTPKALVNVGGITLLERCILNLKRQGVSAIIVNIHHFGYQIIDFVNQHNFGIPIFISDERDGLLDTGGGLKKAQHFFDDGKDFVVHNVDIISEVNLSKMLRFHQEQKAIATLAVRDRLTQRYLLFNENQMLCGKENRQTQERIIANTNYNNLHALAFSGIHIVSPQLFSLMGTANVFSITDLYISLAKEHKIMAFEHPQGLWMDMGKAEDIRTLEKLL